MNLVPCVPPSSGAKFEFVILQADLFTGLMNHTLRNPRLKRHFDVRWKACFSQCHMSEEIM